MPPSERMKLDFVQNPQFCLHYKISGCLQEISRRLARRYLYFSASAFSKLTDCKAHHYLCRYQEANEKYIQKIYISTNTKPNSILILMLARCTIGALEGFHIGHSISSLPSLNFEVRKISRSKFCSSISGISLKLKTILK